MLGSIYGGNSPYSFPETAKSDAMSEDEQFAIIDRALNGDLKGVVTVTQSDMDLYNRHKAAQGTYANEYRKATEFSYVPRAKQEQVKAERAAQMGITPPNQSMGFSSANYAEAKPLYPQQSSNPVLNGYASFNSAPAYSYPNTYYGNGYYNPYFNQYYYQPQRMYDYGDPVTNYAMSKVIEMSTLNNNGYFDNTNNYYSGYYQPQLQTLIIDPNQRPSAAALDFGNRINSNFQNDTFIPLEDKIPEGFEEPVIISMPPELRQNYYGGYGYYNMSPYERAFNSPPPYAQTKQYQDYLKSIQKNKEELMTIIYRSVLGHKGIDYDEYQEQLKASAEENAKRGYNERHKYDNIFNEAELRIKAEQEENMSRVMSNFRCNPYNISFDPSKAWERIERGLASDRQFQMLQKYMPSNMSYVEFVMDGYPAYMERLKYEEFCHEARLDSMRYDSSKYRNAINRSGINNSPYLGFKPMYDPITRQQTSMVTPPESISQKYNERRASYIREAEKRGGIV